MIKLNLGCGQNKAVGYVNIDIDESLKPDLQLDFVKNKLPYDTNSITEVVMTHTIEHIARNYHSAVLSEVNRVLKTDGLFMLSFPDFAICSERYVSNYRGMRDYYEATIFGRGLNEWDQHRAGILVDDMIQDLFTCGFKEVQVSVEKSMDCNKVILAKKSFTLIDKGDLLNKELLLECRA